MTPKQNQFITTLSTEKDLGGLSEVQRAYVLRLVAGEVDPNPAAASRIIEALLALPRKDGRPAVAAPAVEVPAGRYAIEVDGVTKFYIVDRPDEGKWAGRTFVSAQASDEKFPIRNRDSRNAVLTAIAADPQAAMIRYGHELGRCGNCGRTLTDETSRAMGIGPDCAKALGIDRTPAREYTPIETPVETTAAPAGTGADLSVEDEAGDDSPAPAPATRESGSYAGLRAAAGRPDPSKALGWRERKARVDEQQGAGERRNGKAGSSQMQTLPGTTWEDIFGMGVGA